MKAFNTHNHLQLVVDRVQQGVLYATWKEDYWPGYKSILIYK